MLFLLACFETTLYNPRTVHVVHSSQPSSLDNSTTHSITSPKHAGSPCLSCTTECVIKSFIRSGFFRCVAHHLESHNQCIHRSSKPKNPLSSIHAMPRALSF
jgi:hypothetical protein